MSDRSSLDRFVVLLGATLVIVGAILTVLVFAGARMGAFGWPLLVIAPGVLFLLAAFSVPPGRGISFLAIPGFLLIVTGAVLQVQTITGDWQSWSYVWGLIVPGSVGLGLLVAGARERKRGVRIAGAVLLVAGAVLFSVAEWFFVRIAGVGGPGLGRGFGFVTPALVIVIGLWLIVQGLKRDR
jgi:phosphoglycerol transferase MdoB-like AlkP superfamily enzyme